ncbi:hypothetical protein [Myxacorys almedinensis]|uniref:Uncharacterized protein n=1 Tax=Myxacorys almedinensis A TaxID=2690445 RepID=A0A8J7YY88_9CYAN|nr:hypothetical protein [Myxacorys almedinensis]NDJ16842.1 hypothetical protein [Myxacorys almedinensis A]
MLRDAQYANVAISKAFPIITTDKLNEWVQMLETTDDLTVVRAVRQFVASVKAGRESTDET